MARPATPGASGRVERTAAEGRRRLTRVWRSLASEQRLAGICALVLLGTMFLPWYSTTFSQVVEGKLQTQSLTKSALFAFSWVEAAVLLVCVGVLVLLFARGERRAFHLPGGDGLVLTLAGAWGSLLIGWRFFDKPSLGRGVVVGTSWGIFVALAAALALTYAGFRVRRAHRPEPPMPARAREGTPPPAAAEVVLPDEKPHLDETEVLGPQDEREGGS